ncbi:hypothetical protein V495_05300 [Pseudogymnoascus sp. VKM F-4514 (FW-929)]|nr:hypothetical protein V495_05300 [Pseudogymnoascus sp. VKM F-4514 (FW-929)]KFY55329.1 hypothetical protein V497_07068 [Pseudogymnoascus sp. VKM F-4516 (FW-969)]
MALDPAPGRHQTSSPTNSGRASPISRKWRGEEEALSKDKNFRRYASGVDRSLALFDSQLQEWADYISFLGRLLKTLQARPSNITVIPSKGLVARRLAQCLNPTLPSGVHQKAIEVYNYIFSTIGTDSLSRDLPLYLPGLSSTLSFASLTVRSPFLDLLKTHLVPLDPLSLRPALKAIILALLPGLEEETSEDFDQTLKLLNDFKKAVRPEGSQDGLQNTAGDEYFWQCFFLASITGANRRLGALAYLVRSLPKLEARSRSGSVPNLDQEPVNGTEIITTPEPGLLLRCFAAGLKDEQLLIQRGYLDLLVTHLPLHATVFQNRVKADDLELLMTAASGVVARRDMSLNRRLWSWLLGPEPVAGSEIESGPDPVSGNARERALSISATRTSYFEEFGLQPLTQAILKMIARDHLAPAERARPFKVCLSLMDRWEIGGLVVPEVFLPVVGSVRRYQSQSTSAADFNEVLRSASVFFDGVESGLIWSEITGLIAGAVGSNKASNDAKLDKLTLVRFILTNFNVREEEMLLVHAPITALTLMAMLDETASKEIDSVEVKTFATNVVLDLIGLIPERAFAPPMSSQQSESERRQPTTSIDNKTIMEKVRHFYVNDQGNLDVSPPPFSAQEVSELLLREAIRLTSRSLSIATSSADVAVKVRLLVALITTAPVSKSLDVTEILFAIHEKLSASTPPPFSVFSSIVVIVTALYPRYLKPEQISDLVDPLVRLAWSYLSPSCPKYHVEAVRNLWHLQTCLGDANREIEASLCRLIVEHDVTGTFTSRNADPGRRFAVLWTHTLHDNAVQTERRASKPLKSDSNSVGLAPSTGDYEIMLCRPLFLLLDSLSDERTQLFTSVRIWIQNLPGIEKIFHLFVSKFEGFKFLQPAEAHSNASAEKPTTTHYTADDDIDNCLYYLRTFLNILRWSTVGTWGTLANVKVSMPKGDETTDSIDIPLQEFFLEVCLRAIDGTHNPEERQLDSSISQLHRAALAVLHQILANPFSSNFADLNLEVDLISRLQRSLADPDPFLQASLLDVVLASLKLKKESSISPPMSPKLEHRPLSPESNRGAVQSEQVTHDEIPSESRSPPPTALLECLQAAFVSPNSRPVLDNWIVFLSECINLYSDTIFQVLIPLVETFCSQISQTFESLRKTFQGYNESMKTNSAPEATLISFLNGLELVLARGHERLLRDEARAPMAKSPDQPQGFFGNMVSGVFATETHHSRTQTANSRLTVLLSFQDAVRICFKIWSWGGRGRDDFSPDADSVASFGYTSLRMRNRARRLLEHLFHAEPLECLETIIEIWQKASTGSNTQYTAAFHLLHVLDGSRPKHTIPAIFDAIYSRTNPGVLDVSRKSTLTSTLLDTELVVFLVDYTSSVEDDAMDEIWTDCMTFLKDILANPFPHRQILPGLLEFSSVLGEKVDNTNFGEQRKMRKDLADLFLRLLTATFTTNPIGYSMSTSQQPPAEKQSEVSHSSNLKRRAEDVVQILATIIPNLPKILVEPERVLTAANTISTSVVGPTIRSKAYPENVSVNLLTLLYQLSRLPNTQKVWKRDLGDAFNDPRFFVNPPSLYESHWMALIRQWTISDKERMPELLSRITPPTTAGIVFGVGATSARNEADRKTQLNLRRIATLILSVPDDTFVSSLADINDKIVELLTATTTSSPSSTTRAEIYILLRVLVLKTSPIHLAFMWPTVNAELEAAISSVVAPDHSGPAETYTNFSVLQACKLLDMLLCIAPDDFQLHEWLFITDTIDAVYRPSSSSYHPVALIDELAEELGSATLSGAFDSVAPEGTKDKSMRRPLIGPGRIETRGVNLERRDELVGKVLRPFFSQLSIWAFETVYEMGGIEWQECRKQVLDDLFNESAVVNF